ncbi:MAG: OmpH family outer membrane protein [Planctomycetaceae bacterium]
MPASWIGWLLILFLLLAGTSGCSLLDRHKSCETCDAVVDNEAATLTVPATTDSFISVDRRTTIHADVPPPPPCRMLRTDHRVPELLATEMRTPALFPADVRAQATPVAHETRGKESPCIDVQAIENAFMHRTTTIHESLSARLEKLEKDLADSRTAQENLQQELKASQEVTVALRGEVDHWKSELNRLRREYHDQQQADLESLQELTQTLNAILAHPRLSGVIEDPTQVTQ